MDNGLAILIGACVPTAAGFLNEWRAARRAKKIAAQLIEANIQVATDLAIHNAQVGRELETNTKLTRQTMAKVEETANSVNGVLAARLLVEKEASRLEGGAAEKARADAEKKE